MATIAVTDTGTQVPNVALSTAQVGNGDSTNIVDRGIIRSGGLLHVANTAGATPTVTFNILGSMGGTTYFNVAYAAQATPETVTVAAVTVTATADNFYILREGHPWRYLKLNYTANTNETLTTTYWSSGGRQF